jgi:hypothetical protein
MKKIFILLCIPFALFASKILSYNIYDRSDKVDVMLTFDTPYEGVISQDNTQGKIVIKLADSSIESEKKKPLNSKFLSDLTITPLSDSTQITAVVPADIQVQASKTTDEYGLRLRFEKNVPAASSSSTSALPTQQDLAISPEYYIVVGVLLVILGFVLYLKRKMTKALPKTNVATPSMKAIKKPWSFNENTEITEDMNIRFSKQLDPVNKIVMVDYGNLSYLILTGQSNLLLDKFEDNKPVNNNEFEELLRLRNQELEAILYSKPSEKEPFQTYKEKAASIAYDIDL